MNEDQELLDRFAIAAMSTVDWIRNEEDADYCWAVAIAMKQARDRICTTAKPAAEHVPPFPEIDGLPEKPSVIAAKNLGHEPFDLTERN